MNEEFMSDELFAELIQSIREGGAILRGEKEPSGSFVIETSDYLNLSAIPSIA